MVSNTTTSEAEAAAAAAAAAQAALRAFNIEAFTLLAIALLITGLRCVIRIRTVGFKHLWADDYLAVVAALAYSAETALAYSVGNIARGLANNSMTDAQRAALDPNSEEYELRILGSKIQLAGWSTYSFLLWVLKACMCTFYYRLTKDLDGYRSKIYFGFGLIITSWVAVQLNILLSCRPSFSMWWQIHPDPGDYCHPAISPAIVWTGLALNVATDLYLIMIPMPMLWKAAMPWVQKCWLIALFSCGLFVTMAAILRVVLLMADPVNGAMLAGSWAVRETFTAVVTTNIPMLFPHFKKVVGPIVSRVGSSLGFSRNSKSGGGTLDTWKRKSSRHGSIPLPGNTMSGDGRGDDESETYMVDLPERNKGTASSKNSHMGPTGIQRDVEVSVFEMNQQEQQQQYPQQLQRTYTQNGNYTATWSSSQSGTPQTAEQSSYYLGHVHQAGYSNRN